ncbi:hypothetical protein EV361DRAFT_392319 [Lentinula raphanica]|nr:hypothetical protein EV361DRAFT_392319 [Lentinula raphanica]
MDSVVPNTPFVPDLAYLWTPFITLHVLGEAGSILLLLTYLASKNVYRHPTLINFWITWIIYSISYSVLLYDREQYIHPDTLCRVQAAMVDGSPSMVVTAGLVSVIQLWVRIRMSPQSTYKTQSTAKQRLQFRLVLCLLIPYVVFFAFAIGSALVGRENFSLTNPMNGLYCSLHIDGFSRYGIPAYCIAVMTCLISFEVAISINYWHTRSNASRAFTLLKREVPFSLILRMLLFSGISVMIITISIIYMSNWLVPWPYLTQATLPLLSVCIFGTQKDLLTTWACWRRSSTKPHFKRFHILNMAKSGVYWPPAPSTTVPNTATSSGFRTRFGDMTSSNSSIVSTVERATVSDEEPV